MISYDSIACFYDVRFGARAVSRKTPIYFILLKEEKDSPPYDPDFKKAATSGEMEDEKKDEAEEEVAAKVHSPIILIE